MLLNFENKPLGAFDAPFGVRKNYDLGLGAGLIGGIFNLFGSMMDSANVAATNEANRWMNIATNNTNREINESQLAWAKDQYEKEKEENRFLVDQAYNRELENREYNSPVNIKKRYLAAGINPALAMYGQGNGAGSSSVSAQTGQNPHANPPNMISAETGTPMIPYQGLGTTMQQISQLVMLSERQEADISAQREHSRNETIKTLQEIENLKAESKYKDALTHEVIRASEFEDYHLKGRSDNIALSNYLLKVQCKNMLHAMLAKDVELSIQQALAASNIKVNNAQAGMLAVGIANGMLDGRIKSADAALKEFMNGIITDPNNPENRTRDMWNNTEMRHLRFLTQAFGDLLNDVIPLRDLLKLGK